MVDCLLKIVRDCVLKNTRVFIVIIFFKVPIVKHRLFRMCTYYMNRVHAFDYLLDFDRLGFQVNINSTIPEHFLKHIFFLNFVKLFRTTFEHN